MNQELDNALYIAKRDALGWTSQDVQTLAEAYRNAWENKDCEALEALSNAMSDVSYGEVTENTGLFKKYDFKRDYIVEPNAEKYGNLLGALDSDKEGELYYTLSRMSMMPTEVQTAKSDFDNGCTAEFSYHFENTDSGMQVSLNSTPQGMKEQKLYSITAVDMNEVITPESVGRLKGLGYQDNELTTLKLSALTDEDVDFVSMLAAGNYEGAFRVNPLKISEFTKVSLSAYEAILGTRADSKVCNSEMEKQINVLLNQDSEWVVGSPVSNAHEEYISIINSGLQWQNQVYSKNMTDMYNEGRPITNAYFDYGDKLNRVVSLWDSFDNIEQNVPLENFNQVYGHAVRDRVMNLQVSDLRTLTEDGQYRYSINMVDAKTNEKIEDAYGIEVNLSQLGPQDALRSLLVDENIANIAELEEIKKNTVANTTVALVDGLVPLPVQDGYRLLVSLTDFTASSSDAVYSVKMAGNIGALDKENKALDKVGNAFKVAGNVFYAINTGVNDYMETQAEIDINKEYLNYSFNGQLNKMNLYVDSVNGGSISDEIQIGIQGMTPEVQYNTMRLQEHGIVVCLQDLNKSDIDVKDIFEALNVDHITAECEGEVTREEVAYAVETILNGGDFSKISPEVRGKVEEKINGLLGEDGMSIWMQQRNIPDETEWDWDKLMDNGYSKLDLSEVEPQLTVINGVDGNIYAVEGGLGMQAIKPSEKAKINEEFLR